MYPSKSLSNFEFIDQPNDNLHQLEWNDKLAIAVSNELSLSPIQNGKNQMDPKLKIYCFGNLNGLHQNDLTLLMRKDFPFMEKLNEFVRHASDVGLVAKWLKSYRSIAEKPSCYNYEIFKAQNLYVVFEIGLCIFLIAFIVVIIERFVHKSVRSGNCRRFWRYIEMTIDPYRYLLLNELAY